MDQLGFGDDDDDDDDDQDDGLRVVQGPRNVCGCRGITDIHSEDWTRH